MNVMKELDSILASKNFLKVISLIIAVGLWLYVNGDIGSHTEKELECNLQYLNLSSELTLSVEEQMVQVGVSGPRERLSSLKPEDILCDVDLKGLNSGKYRMPVRVVLPGTLKLKYVRPANIEFSILRYAEKVLPVHISMVENLPSGVLIDSVEFSPKEVTVRGPETKISLLEKVVVSPSVEELKGGGVLTLPVKLIQLDGDDLNLTVFPSNVDLSAVLRKGLPRKTVPVDVPLVGEVDENYTIGGVVITPSSVEIEGPENQLLEIKKIQTDSIDIRKIKESKSVVVPVKLDKKFNDVSFTENKTVMVKLILKDKTSNRLLSRIPIEIKGRSVYPGWEMYPKSVNIKIEGPLSVMKKLQSEDIPLSAYVDVTNIVSRELKVPVTVKTKFKKIRVISVNPARVTVKALLN